MTPAPIKKAGPILETAHRYAAGAAGRVSLMISTKKASAYMVECAVNDLLRAVEYLRQVLPPK